MAERIAPITDGVPPRSARTLPIAAPPALAITAALVAVQFCFGANYVISKVVVSNFPPLVWAGIRIAIATAVMFAVCIATKRPRPKLDRAFLLPLAGFALMGTILNQAAFLTGLKMTTSTNSAVLNTLIPIATLALVTIRGQEEANWKKGVGFLLALTGVLSIRRLEDVHFSDATVIGDLLNIFNCLIYACFLSFSKNFISKHDSLWVTAFLFLYGTIGINLIAIPSWISFVPPEMTGSLWLACAGAVGIGTLAAYFLNFWALKYAKPSQVALFIYLQPIIAAGIAYVWFGEKMSFRVAVSSALIFLGMLTALAGSYGKAKKA
ncbi:MAG: DMT family transporter [Bdellovibrionales bacterium]|nr:DMT family transporter [Bdellovibrionales bacterium]